MMLLRKDDYLQIIMLLTLLYVGIDADGLHCLLANINLVKT